MLSNRALYRIWRQRLAQLIPEGLTHQRYRVENLFWLVIGIYQARHIALSLIARKVPLRVQKLSLVRRFRRFLDNRAIRPRDWYQPVLAGLIQAASQGDSLHLAIDCTSVGSRCLLMMVAVVYRRRALPIAWSWVPIPKGRGRSTEQAQLRLLAYINRHIHPHTSVSLVGDAEFGGGQLIAWLKRHGWRFALAQRQSVVFFPPFGGYYALADVPIEPGYQLWVSAATLSKVHALECNILVYQEPQQDSAWYLATNLPDARTTIQHYRRRMWIEALFADMKRQGFHLWHSRLGTPQRLDRLTFIVCLLYVWLVAMGEYVLFRGRQAEVDRAGRQDLSIFRLGWDWVERRLLFSDPLPSVFVPRFQKVSGS